MDKVFADYRSFLKRMGEEPYSTVFLVGTGLIEGGWPTFIRGASAAFGRPLTQQTVISPIAYLTAILRTLSKSKDKDSKGFKERLSLIRLVRTEIAKKFREDQSLGHISLRITGDSDYFDKLKQGRPLIITTNYDTLLHERYFKNKLSDVLSLHGNVNWPQGIYLPTEMSTEPYHGCLDRGPVYLKQAHRIAIEAFECAKRIVIWGNSLDVYDSELYMVLTEGYLANMNSPKIFVVDPSINPANRLKALIGNVAITYVDPKNGATQEL